MKFIGIIPARYASARFPGKPLADIKGKSMIRRVVEQASKSEVLAEVIVATDDDRIFRHVQSFGKVVMTAKHHQSGTERCLEAAEIWNKTREEKIFDHDVIINIQGDEPFISPAQIQLLAGIFDNPECNIATLIKKIQESEELFNPNVVKVVTGKDHKALYFSRSPIPFVRNKPEKQWPGSTNFYQHIGMYGYKMSTLKKITALPPSPIEAAESLEQLRWLHAHFRIFTAVTSEQSISVDTPEDLEKIPDHLI